MSIIGMVSVDYRYMLIIGSLRYVAEALFQESDYSLG